MLAPELQRTMRQPAVELSAEPANCAAYARWPGPGFKRLLEPDALVRAALGVEEQADQRAVEQQRDDHREVDDLGAEHGDEHDGLEDGSGDGDWIRPLPLVGDPVPADREPDDRHQAEQEARRDDPEQQAEDGVDVEEERAQDEGLRLGLVQELALVHTAIVAQVETACAPAAITPARPRARTPGLVGGS